MISNYTVRLFLAKVNKTDTCWLWTAAISARGYGKFWLDSRWQQAHRASYQIYKGPIPDGLEVMHSCHNKLCVNPEHLSVGTHADNLKDNRKFTPEVE